MERRTRRSTGAGRIVRRLAGAPLVAALALCGHAAPAEKPPESPLAARIEPKRIRVRDFKEVYKPTQVTRAVDRGLEYLRRTQIDDGSWFSPNLGKNTGVVSLATMAFLAAGHEPGRGIYGQVIDKAVLFILSHRQEGMLVTRDTSHGPMYEHGIATLLLGELIGMLHEDRPGFERVRSIHREAVHLILRAQRVRRGPFSAGGWRYEPWSTDADLSVTGWQLLALRAAQDAGVSVPARSIQLAVGYVKRCQLPSGGFGYMPGTGYDPSIARTAMGVLSLQICGDFQSLEARRGGDWLLKHPLQWKGPFFYYGVYYSTQAAYQLGGSYWERWKPRSQGILLERQQADGRWIPPPRETHEHQAGPAYSTALAILSLTVDYKYLPIYQR